MDSQSVSLALAGLLPPAEAVPSHVQTSFVLWFITGTISVVPGIFFSGWCTWMAAGNLITLLTNYDFFNNERVVENDPIEARYGLPRDMLLTVTLPLIHVFILVISTAAVIFVGAFGRLQSDASQGIQARRLTRVATFVAISFLPMVATAAPFQSLRLWHVATSFAAVILLRSIQLVLYRPIVIHTLSLRPRAPHEILILVLAFLLLTLSVAQLTLTPIIGGSSSCNCKWDVYPLWVKVCQSFGGGASAFGAVVGFANGIGHFLDKSATLTKTRWYNIAMWCNGFGIITGVILTEVYNRNMFSEAGMNLTYRRVFWASSEQPLMTFCLLTAVVVVERTLTWLLVPAEEAQLQQETMGDEATFTIFKRRVPSDGAAGDGATNACTTP